MFRGKESSNRIELSRLVQELLNFGVLGSLQLWGGGRWVVRGLGGWGVSPHMCTPMHMHTCMHTHTRKILQMAANMFIMILVSSPSSPCRPCHPHIIPVIPTSSPILHLTPHPLPPLPKGDHPNQ